MPIAVDHCRAPHQANTQFGESLFRAAASAAARATTLLEGLAAAPADKPRFWMVPPTDGGGNQTLARCLADFSPVASITRRLQAKRDASSDDAVRDELKGVIDNIGIYVPLDKETFPSVRWLAPILGKPLFVLELVPDDAAFWSSVSQQQRCTVVNADSAGGAEAYVACKSSGGANIDEAICILHAGHQYRLLESLGWSTERIETFIKMAKASIFDLGPDDQIDQLRRYLPPGCVVADATAAAAAADLAFTFIGHCVDNIKPKIHFQWDHSVKQVAWKHRDSYKTLEKRSIIVSIFDDVFAALQGMWTKAKIDDFIALCNANGETVDTEEEGYIRNFLTGSKEENPDEARLAATTIDPLLQKQLRVLNIEYDKYAYKDCIAVQDFVPEKTRVCFEAWYQVIKAAAAAAAPAPAQAQAQAQAPAQLPGTAAAGAGVRAAVLIRRAGAAAAAVAGARAAVAVADLNRRAAAAAAAAVVAGATAPQQLVDSYKSEEDDEESDEDADDEARAAGKRKKANSSDQSESDDAGSRSDGFGPVDSETGGGSAYPTRRRRPPGQPNKRARSSRGKK